LFVVICSFLCFHIPILNNFTLDAFAFLSFLKCAGGYNNWPTGRGIFFNEEKTFLVWINEEDHLRIISMQTGGNLGNVYKRLVTVRTASKK
jgi:hypothetical protein